VSGLYLVLKKKATGLEKIIAFSTIILGLSLILFSRSNNLVICLLLIFLVGMTNTLTLAAISNFIQLILVDENKRGRVTSIFTTGFLGILPFGNLFFGGLASKFGVDNALLVGGISCFVGACFFAMKLPEMEKIVFPVYIKMGLITQANHN
ncbi:MAG: MFS transporter, partial [Nostoc sp. C3-bin3]|nr:MFS transporter [Nostoc sp. C3-bin3]